MSKAQSDFPSIEEPFLAAASGRFLVAQIGPRRGYSVAAALDQANMLEALYTDVCAELSVGKLLCYLGRAFEPDAIRRLQGRRIPASVLAKTRSFAWPALLYECEKRLAGVNPYRQARALSSFAARLGRAMTRAGFGEASHIYTMLGDVTPLLEAARARGLCTVTEIYSIPTTEQIRMRERMRYPGFEEDMPSDLLDVVYSWLRHVIALSDWLVVPSPAVQSDLVRNFGVNASRCLLVPYGVEERWFELQNRPVNGRVLFVGTACIGKGIHTFAQAARLLGNEPYSYHVAGDVSDPVRKHPLTDRLTFLGRIPRMDVAREYEAADVLVLPSLAEGSAESTLQALAAGIPVVTTKAAGSVVRDGMEGFIIEGSDPDALAARVRQIVQDRNLRQSMSHSARQRAHQFTLDKYSKRLATALANLPSRS